MQGGDGRDSRRHFWENVGADERQAVEQGERSEWQDGD